MATYPIKILKDENQETFLPLTSTKGVRDEGGRTLEQRLQEKLGPSNLHGGTNINVRTENYDCYIDLDLPSSLNIINNLITTGPGQGALDAYQGKVLKDSIPGIVNGLSSTDTSKALSAYQGKVLQEHIDNISLKPGPQGERGPIGPQGPKGDNGAPGHNPSNAEILELIYPIGSLYISTSGTDPKTVFNSWGTWERLQGGFLYGAVESWGTGNGTGTSTNAGGSGNTGVHTLTVEEIPSHDHSVSQWNSKNAGSDGRWCNNMEWRNNINSNDINYWTGMVSATGGGQGHDHTLPSHSHTIPYIAVFMWRRTK